MIYICHVFTTVCIVAEEVGEVQRGTSEHSVDFLSCYFSRLLGS